MKEWNNYDVATCNQMLEEAIEKEEEEKVEQLVNILAEKKAINEKAEMPKDFVKQIVRKARKGADRKKWNTIKIAAASVAAVCVISGTAYAANYLRFSKVTFMDYGMVAEEKHGDNVVIEENETETEKDNTKNTFTPLLEGDYIEVLEALQGDETTKWTSKVTKLDKTPSYSSDDGKTWVENTDEEPRKYTEYRYNNLEDALEDSKLINIFGEKALSGYDIAEEGILYTEGYLTQEEKETMGYQYSYKGLKANYVSGKKRIECILDYNQNMQKELQNPDETIGMVTNIITGTEKSKNQRYYTTKNNVKYALEENKRDGKECTTAYVTGNGYNWIISFYEISEKEIHTILNNFHAELLLEQ